MGKAEDGDWAIDSPTAEMPMTAGHGFERVARIRAITAWRKFGTRLADGRGWLPTRSIGVEALDRLVGDLCDQVEILVEVEHCEFR